MWGHKYCWVAEGGANVTWADDGTLATRFRRQLYIFKYL